MPADRRQFLAGAALALAAPALALPPPRPPRDDAGDTLLAGAVLALAGGRAALGRFVQGHCADWCDVCLDADACLYILDTFGDFLEGNLVPTSPFSRRRSCRQAWALDPARPADEVLGLALSDVLDALLDLTAWHCSSWDCCVCQDADALVSHVCSCLSLVGGALNWSPAVLRRQLLTASRCVERARAMRAEGGAFMPHSARCHCEPESQARNLRRLLAIVEGRPDWRNVP